MLDGKYAISYLTRSIFSVFFFPFCFSGAPLLFIVAVYSLPEEKIKAMSWYTNVYVYSLFLS